MKKLIISMACFASLAYGSGAITVEPLVGYQTCFVPGQNCAQFVAQEIGNSKSTIDVQAYGFTNADIIGALVSAENRDVKVRIILDKSNLKQSYSGLKTIEADGIPTWIDYKRAIAHNKIMIIDGKEVITGSFNFTTAAQKSNAENLIVLYSPDIAKAYEQNFMSRLAASKVAQ